MKKATYIFLLVTNCLMVQAQIDVRTFKGKNGETETYTKTLINPRKTKYGLVSDEWNIEVKYANGQIKRIGEYNRGMWNGAWKMYSEKGVLLFEGEFHLGYPTGKHTYYYYSGQMKEMRLYYAGEKTGTWVKFDSNGDTALIRSFENGELQSEVSRSTFRVEEKHYANGKLNGLSVVKMANGVVIEKGSYLDGYKIGEWVCNDSTGKKEGSYIYSRTDTSSLIQLPSTYELIHPHNKALDTFTVQETMPEFVGGEKQLLNFVFRTVEYPAYSRDNDYQDRINIGFDVSETGAVEYVFPRDKGKYSELTEEAIRVIELLPDFKPATQQGKNVRTAFTIPVSFKLQ